MKILLSICLALLSLSVFAQKTATVNDPDAKTRVLNATFHAIKVTDGIDVLLTPGTEESIAVSFSDQKYEEKFQTVVEEGVLKIYYDSRGTNWASNNKRKLKAYVSYKAIDKLTISGGATITLVTAGSFGKLDMSVSSGARFDGTVKASELIIDQSSGSIVELSGSADQLTLEAGSGAIFKGYEMSASYCNAKASSGASIRITIDKELNARANSGGGIHYKGNGVIKDLNVNSGGVVKKAK